VTALRVRPSVIQVALLGLLGVVASVKIIESRVDLIFAGLSRRHGTCCLDIVVLFRCDVLLDHDSVSTD